MNNILLLLLIGVLIGLMIHQTKLEGFTEDQCHQCCQNAIHNCYRSDENPDLWGCIHPHMNLKPDRMCLDSRPTHDCPDPADSDFHGRATVVRQSPTDVYYDSAWDPTIFAIGNSFHNYYGDDGSQGPPASVSTTINSREDPLSPDKYITYNVDFDTTDFSK